MLDSKDPNTVCSMRELSDLVRKQSKRIVFWIGAGASSWNGYPRWDELAQNFHTQYVRHETGYDKEEAFRLITKKDFPDFFQLCRDTNSRKFHSLLADKFSVRSATPVYQRFALALKQVAPTRVITTNVDEVLEKELPGVPTIGRRDLERVADLLSTEQGFVCKLHGSIGDIGTTVFTTTDYASLERDVCFTSLLERLLASTIVVFVGYGLQDDYVLSILARNCSIAAVFGDGPHFAILPIDHGSLPFNVRTIHYIPKPHKDHRTVLQIVEEIGSLRNPKQSAAVLSRRAEVRECHGQSAHILFDIYPPGTWETSQTLNITSEDGAEKQAIVGTGFTATELPNKVSSAMHDMVVGLLCFDHVYASLSSLARVHDLIESGRFWHLVQNDILCFLACKRQEAVIFPGAGAIADGCLVSMAVCNPDRTERTTRQLVRQQLNPAPGKEGVASLLLDQLSARTFEIPLEAEEEVPDSVRSLLLRPTIRRLLGMSEGTPLRSLARWNVYPVLRLANVVRIGVVCRELGISSARLNFGAARLAGPAFAAACGAEGWADEAASYVLAGNFGSDLGQLVMQDRSLLDIVLAFRETPAGVQLRQEVLVRLAANEGAEAAAAINGGLRNALPAGLLQEVRDSFVAMFATRRSQGVVPPAIWNDTRDAESGLIRWRRRSREILNERCNRSHIGLYGACPCGSGEKLRFCCLEALTEGR